MYLTCAKNSSQKQLNKNRKRSYNFYMVLNLNIWQFARLLLSIYVAIYLHKWLFKKLQKKYIMINKRRSVKNKAFMLASVFCLMTSSYTHSLFSFLSFRILLLHSKLKFYYLYLLLQNTCFHNIRVFLTKKIFGN